MIKKLLPLYLILLLEDIKSIFRSKKKIPFFVFLNMWKNGFFGKSYFIYSLEKRSKKFYLTDYQRKKTGNINKGYTHLLSNKLVFSSLIEGSLNTPKIHALIKKNKIYNLSTQYRINDYTRILNLLQKERKLFFKPNKGYGGKGVFLVEYKKNENKYYLNYKPLSMKKLANKFKSLNEYLCCEYIDQKGYANKIFSKSVNTIRVLSCLHPISNKSFIAIAVHRFGNEESKPADNWHKNGYCSLIDLKSGNLDKAAIINNKTWCPNFVDKHPETGQKIAGVKIPYWSKIKKQIMSTHNKINFIPYIGWDVCVSGDKFYILEGNNHTDVDLLQVHRPLLLNKKLRKFYEYHKIV